jgi:hypothetical protein
MLFDHPEIYWAGELLSDHRLRKRNLTGFDQRKYMKREEFASTRKFYGIEVKFGDLRFINVPLPDFVSHLKNVGYDYFILLCRNNGLRRIVSLQVAKKTGTFHIKGNTTSGITRVHIDPSKLIAIFEHEQEDFQRVKALLHEKNILELTYEDDIEKDPRVAYQKVCNYIGVTPQNISPILKRINPYSLEEIIVNYDEVKNVLRNTPYEWMLTH